MGLNIKNAEAEEAIRELAELTGEGLTEAVANAAREKIARLKTEKKTQTVEEFLAAIRPLQDALAAERKERGDTRTSKELMDELYDEHGLPA
ncbi:MAG TPA: type II toxin-antitoxin system VapB family antitoxin [Rhizomicrobium sp.]|nr:type II toxin-antitoxin system VapB family antitoxin [Rhizomicrobium sp.]